MPYNNIRAAVGDTQTVNPARILMPSIFSAVAYKETGQSQNMSWPPTEQDFRKIAGDAAKERGEDTYVLVYWSNPTFMIFDPMFFAHTEYIEQTWQVDNYKIKIIIGKVD